MAFEGFAGGSLGVDSEGADKPQKPATWRWSLSQEHGQPAILVGIEIQSSEERRLSIFHLFLSPRVFRENISSEKSELSGRAVQAATTSLTPT